MPSSPLFNFFLKICYLAWSYSKKKVGVWSFASQVDPPPQALLIVRLSFERSASEHNTSPSTPTLAHVSSAPHSIWQDASCIEKGATELHLEEFLQYLQPHTQHPLWPQLLLLPPAPTPCPANPGYLNLLIKIWILRPMVCKHGYASFLALGKPDPVDVQWDLGTCVFTFVVILMQLSTWSIFYNNIQYFSAFQT